jgi:hypothetical protein
MASDTRPKAIYLHLRHDSEESIRHHLALAEKLFPGRAWTTARAFFAEKIGPAGGWSEWETLVSRTFATQAISQRTLGKATANIIRLALAAGKKVVLLADGHALDVEAVIERDARNWQGGWEVKVKHDADSALAGEIFAEDF